MVTNPNARTFFEFVTKHRLSLNQIAQTAGISHGTLRAFRDTEGRTLNRHTRLAVGRALHAITHEAIDIVEMFGSPEDDEMQWSVNSIENQFLMNILLKRNITAQQLAVDAEIDLSVVQSLLRRESIGHDDARKIAATLGQTLEDIGIRSADFSLDKFSSAGEPRAEISASLPIRRILIRRMQHDECAQAKPNHQINENFHELIISEEVIGTTARPPSLMKSDDAYALYAPDSQMWPRIEEGDLVYVDPNWPAKPNDDAIVYIQSERRGLAFLAHLVSRDANEFTFSCYTASGVWPVNKNCITAIHKILRGKELIIR